MAKIFTAINYKFLFSKQRFIVLMYLIKNHLMNLKKMLILPVGFLFTNMMYIACCNCKPINKHYFEATNFTLMPSGSNNTTVDNGSTVYMDSLYLDGKFNVNCIAAHQNPFSFLVNTATACSCESCGDAGLKYPISSIEITSNNVFNSVPAGLPLNNFFKSYNKYYSSYPAGIPVDSIKTLINKKFLTLSYLTLFTQTKPANNMNHQLTMTATFANGVTFSSKTKNINWQ
jgi:hypothetical protein